MAEAKKRTRELAERRRDFINRLAMMHTEAGRLELWGTMHALHDAVRKVGWELADLIGPRKVTLPLTRQRAEADDAGKVTR